MTSQNSQLYTSFIDLATYDEQEKYMYGGRKSPFQRVNNNCCSPKGDINIWETIPKLSWFSQVPTLLSTKDRVKDFGREFSVSISRNADNLLQTWLHVTIPSVTVSSDNSFDCLRWTKNLMHNLIKECYITFTDKNNTEVVQGVHRFNNYHLDFWNSFMIPLGKKSNYNTMIGNIDELTVPQRFLPSKELILPLPFFFSRDVGLALPVAAIVYQEMKIHIVFRDWSELLILENMETFKVSKPSLENIKEKDLHLKDVEVWGNYTMVSGDERKRMACMPLTKLIEQVHTIPVQSFDPLKDSQEYDLSSLNRPVKTLFFAVRNKTKVNNWSNYTSKEEDPIAKVSLIYENTSRLKNMRASYFSLLQPYYHSVSTPSEVGLHMYSYALNMNSIDPNGSTNYSQLINPRIVCYPSEAAKRAAQEGEEFEFILTATVYNVIDISKGTLKLKF
jgi:hypothetical protein